MARHRPDRRRVKIHRSYTVEEAARSLNIARGTVRRWLKRGLPAIDGRKPALIRGSDLQAYLNAKARPKHSCPPGQCYCVKCKAPKEPAGSMAEYVVMTPTSGNLRAMCPTCETLMHRRTSLSQLEEIRGFLDVTMVERSPRLRDSDKPSTNDH
jgi:excisionase family DNA binding protein